MKHLTKFLALGAFCTLLAGLTSCNEEPEYAQTVIEDFGKKDLTALTIGETFSPVLSSDEKTGLTWTSADESIASVSAEGVITGVAKGKTTITAKDTNGNSIAEIKVIVLNNQFILAENGKQISSFSLDSCMDAWTLKEETGLETGNFYHVLMCYRKSISSNGHGWFLYPAEESGFACEIPLLIEHALSDEYIPIKAGTYKIDLDWDFDYKYMNTEYEYDDDWIYLFQGSWYQKFMIDIKKSCEKYSFKLTGKDVYGRDWFLAYNGKIFGQYSGY